MDCVFCCGYSGDRLGRFLWWASSLFFDASIDEAVTTSVGRSFHIFTTLWLKVNLRRSSLDRFFLSFRGWPRSLEVSAFWRKFRHWTPSRKPELSKPISCLPCPSNESRFSKWALYSSSMSWRPVTSLVERPWTSSSSLMPFLSHGHQALNEYSKWGRVKVPYNLSKSVSVIFINNTLMALTIEFALFAAFAHWWWGLSALSTITPKLRCWITFLRRSSFSWYWWLLSFAWRCSLRTTHLYVLKLTRAPWDQFDK